MLKIRTRNRDGRQGNIEDQLSMFFGKIFPRGGNMNEHGGFFSPEFWRKIQNEFFLRTRC